MPKALKTTLWVIWLIVIWFFASVFTAIAFDKGSFTWLAYLLGIFWLIYLGGLWLEKSPISDTAWAMLLGFAIGMIRLLDKIQNIQDYVSTVRILRHVPGSILGIIGLAFILIFVGVLPLIAKNVIASHKAKNRVLGRDD